MLLQELLCLRDITDGHFNGINVNRALLEFGRNVLYVEISMAFLKGHKRMCCYVVYVTQLIAVKSTLWSDLIGQY